jgi:hypothetical protein
MGFPQRLKEILKMATTVTTFDSLPVSLAWQKGRMRGALICGTFGAIWMFEALFFGGIATPVLLTVVGLLTVAAIAWPVIRLRSFRGMRYTTADRERWARLAVPYWINCGIEWALCCGAAFWLARVGQYALIPECLGVIIGLHFLPLGKMFRSPIYYATGAAMVVGSLAALTVDAGPLRNIAAFGVNGLSLWGTAAVILCQDWFSKQDWISKTQEEN